MRRSTRTILTTHVGSLPAPVSGERHPAPAELRVLFEKIVTQQRDVGLDIINEGEWTKGGDWLSYV